MACSTGLNNAIAKVTKNLPWINFDQNAGEIEVMLDAEANITRKNYVETVYKIGKILNDTLNKTLPKLKQFAYVRWANNKPYIHINPSIRQANYINDVKTPPLDLRESAQAELNLRTLEYNDKIVHKIPTEPLVLPNKKSIPSNLEKDSELITEENDSLASFDYEAALLDIVGVTASPQKELAASKVLSALSEKFNIPWQWYVGDNRKGYIKDGVVYINKDLFDESTLFHEFAHPFIEYIAQNNPQIYNLLVVNGKKVINANTNRTVAEEVAEHYSDLSPEDLNKEIVTTALGLAAVNQLIEPPKSTFFHWLDKLLSVFSKVFGRKISLTTPYSSLAGVLTANDFKYDLIGYIKGEYDQRDTSLTQDDIIARFNTWSNQFTLDEKNHIYTDKLTGETIESVHTQIVDPLYKKEFKGNKTFTYKQQYTSAVSATFGTGVHALIQYIGEEFLNGDKTLNLTKLFNSDIKDSILHAAKIHNLHIVNETHKLTRDDGAVIPVNITLPINDVILNQTYNFVVDFLFYKFTVHGADAKYFFEQKVYSENYLIGKKRTKIIGTADLVVIEGPSKENGAYYIHDWKTTSTKYFQNFGMVDKDGIMAIKKLHYKEQQLAYGKMIGGNFKQGIAYPIGANLWMDKITKLPTAPRELEFPVPDPLKADPGKRVLYPVIVDGNDKIEGSLEELVEKLKFIQDRIKDRKLDLSEDETHYDRLQRVRAIERIIEDLETRKSVNSLITEIAQIIQGVENQLSTMNLADVERYVDLLTVYTTLDTYLNKIEGLSPVDLARGLSAQNSVNITIEKLNNKRKQLLLKIADDQSIFGLLNPEVGYSTLGRYFKAATTMTGVKTIALFAKLKRAVLNKRDKKVKDDITELTKLSAGLKAYGQKKGLSIHKVYLKFLKVDKNGKAMPRLTSRYSSNLYQDLFTAISEEDVNKIKSLIDIPSHEREFNIQYNRLKTKWEDIINNMTILSDEIAFYAKKHTITLSDDEVAKIMKAELLEKKLEDFIVTHKLIFENGDLNIEALKNLFSRNNQEKTAKIKRYDLLKISSTASNYYETAQYKEIQNTPELKNFYDFMLKINEEAFRAGVISYADIFSFIPKAIADSIEKAERGDRDTITLKTLKEKWSPDQVDENTVVQTVFNPITRKYEKEVQKLFQNNYTTFIKNSDPTKPDTPDYQNYSLDLVKLYGQYSLHLRDYEARTEVAPVAEAILNLEKTKKNVVTNRWGKVKKVDGDVQTDHIQANVELLETIINRDIYNMTHKTTKDTAIPLPWKKDGVRRKISLNKFLLWIISLNSDTNLGLNLYSAASTFFGGNINAFFETNRNNIFNKKDYVSSLNAIASIVSNNLVGEKDLSFLHLTDPMMENENVHRVSRLSSTQIRKIFNRNNLYEGMRRGDRAVQYSVALAVLKNFAIVNGELVNINDYVRETHKYNGKTYKELAEADVPDMIAINAIRKEIDAKIEEMKKQSVYAQGVMENGTLKTDLTDEMVWHLRDVIRSQNAKIIGNMSQDDKINAKNTLLGTAMMQYRNWMPALFEQRFGAAEMDLYGNLSWGKARTFISTFNTDFLRIIRSAFSTIDEASFGRIREKYNELYEDFIDEGGDPASFVTLEKFTEYYLANIRSSFKELALYLAFAMLIFALSSLLDWDPDDKDKEASQKIVYKLYGKLMGEITFFYSPMGIGSIISSPLPAFSTLVNLEKFISKTVAEGYYGVGSLIGADTEQDLKDNKPLKYAFKLFPVAKELANWLAIFDEDFRKEFGIQPTRLVTY